MAQRYEDISRFSNARLALVDVHDPNRGVAYVDSAEIVEGIDRIIEKSETLQARIGERSIAGATVETPAESPQSTFWQDYDGILPQTGVGFCHKTNKWLTLYG